MSIQQNFPAISPSLSLNFARSKTLDPRITFSRTSTATRVNETGLIEVMSADEPRFDHKYENGVVKSLGLLIEEQRTNILQQSVVTTSNWGGSTSNTTYSDLSLNALGIFPGVEVTTTTGAAWHRRTTGYNVPFVSGTEYAVTFYYREGTSGSARLQFRYNSQESLVQGPADGSAWSIQQTIGSISNVTTTLMDGQSTYKTTYRFTPNFTGNADMGIGVGSLDAGDTIIALGGQVEAGAFPTSYIPTEGSTKTRSPDNVSMTGTNFSDWYNQTEGTISCSFRAQSSETKYLMGISNNSAGELIYIRATSTGSDSAMRDGGSDVAYKPIAYSRDIDTLSKHCVSYKQDDFIVSAQGQISTVDDTCTVPTPTNISIGSLYNTAHLGGTIAQLTYYPVRLSNDILQTLTK